MTKEERRQLVFALRNDLSLAKAALFVALESDQDFSALMKLLDRALSRADELREEELMSGQEERDR